MYAVIATGGKQYRVTEGQVIKVEKLSVETGEPVHFDQVLLATDGDKYQIGKPYLKGAKVSAKVLDQAKHKKVGIIKLKRRKHHLRRKGHRQSYTEVEITHIKV